MYLKILSKTKRAFKIKKYKTIFENIIHYQSIPELLFIKWCELKNIKIQDGPSIVYELNNKRKIYYSDFLIEELTGKRIIEIKRKHLWWYQDIKSGQVRSKAKAAIKYSKENKYLPYKILFENAS
jgi:hypothetical protein